MLGLNTKPADDVKKEDKKPEIKKTDSQADEAKAILAKMQEKADGDACPFC